MRHPARGEGDGGPPGQIGIIHRMFTKTPGGWPRIIPTATGLTARWGEIEFLGASSGRTSAARAGRSPATPGIGFHPHHDMDLPGFSTEQLTRSLAALSRDLPGGGSSETPQRVQ